MCFECSKGPSNRDGSFEYPQYMFWMRNKENNFPIRTLVWRPDNWSCKSIFDLFESGRFTQVLVYIKQKIKVCYYNK